MAIFVPFPSGSQSHLKLMKMVLILRNYIILHCIAKNTCYNFHIVAFTLKGVIFIAVD